jgi:hypothetical protein
VSKYEIERALVLSTAHVSEETALLLNHTEILTGDAGLAWAPAMQRPEGWLFRVPLNMSDAEWTIHLEPYPAELRAALALARDEGCHWILFDCDGPTVDTLTEFEW